MYFRTASEEDAAALLDIYRYYVEKTAITFEWEVPSLENFKRRISHTLEKYPYIVAQSEGRILGYAYAGPFKERKAYDWSAETTIYLDHTIRHQGVGKLLYMKLEESLKKMHILNLNACIGYPETNDEYLTDNSARFHEHLGYSFAGRFHDSGYKFSRWYDMIWMEKMIGDHTDQPADVIPYKMLKQEAVHAQA